MQSKTILINQIMDLINIKKKKENKQLSFHKRISLQIILKIYLWVDHGISMQIYIFTNTIIDLGENLLYPLNICNERFKKSRHFAYFFASYTFCIKNVKSLMNLPKSRGLLTSHRVCRVLFHSNRASSFAPRPPDGDTYTRPGILHGGAIRNSWPWKINRRIARRDRSMVAWPVDCGKA